MNTRPASEDEETSKVWGYRSVEKTILDLNKIGSSADIGLGVKGKTGGAAYHVMLGNGPGQKPENDNGKKIYGALTVEPLSGVQLQGYFDFNMRPAGQDELTTKAFVGIHTERFRVGFESFMRIDKESGVAEKAGDDVSIAGASLFAAMDLSSSLAGFGRVDAVNNNDTDTADLLAIAGIDYAPAKNVHLMPNIRIEMPDDLHPNIQVRVTSYYKF